MSLGLASLRLLLLQAVFAYTSVRAQAQNGTQDIQWGPCEINGSPPFECGNVSVPLDYTSPNSTELGIELIKYTALKQPSKGSILINFGGPGASGQQLMVTLGPVMQAVTGGYYDLISFDPRSAGKTIPLLCYQSAAERINATFQNSRANGNASDTTLGRLWASGENLATACYDNGKDIGGLLGFSFAARDYLRIAEILNEDGLLRYYGLSGGTVLGATIAAMFPDRIERMVLDGVWNIHEYYHSHGAVEGFTSTDATFSALLRACIAAGPAACALSTHPNVTAAALEAATYALIQRVKYQPIPHAGTLLDYTLVRNAIFLGQATLALWPPLAAFLDALLFPSARSPAQLDAALAVLQTAEDPVFAENRLGIQCGDKLVRARRLADVLPDVEAVSRLSRLAGDRIAFDIAACARWRMDARETYAGDFDVTTRHPVLIIGNTLDPVTPLVSARNASESLRGSVVLQHDGVGHCSPQQVSVCTAGYTKAYYEDGTLPDPGTVCEVDVPPFSNVTWQDVLL